MKAGLQQAFKQGQQSMMLYMVALLHELARVSQEKNSVAVVDGQGEGVQVPFTYAFHQSTMPLLQDFAISVEPDVNRQCVNFTLIAKPAPKPGDSLILSDATRAAIAANEETKSHGDNS